MLIERPKLQWREDGTWRLLEAYTLGEITVPPDFVLDGASVPKIFCWYADEEGAALPAAIIHDYEYSVKEASRREADARFYRNLVGAGIRRSKAWVMWAAVRAGGWAAWRG